MPPRTRKDIESMTFMALMDEIGIGPLSCNCSTCLGEKKARPGLRPSNTKSAAMENLKPVSKDHTHSATCNHGFSLPPPSSTVAAKKPASPQAQTKPAPVTTTTTPQGRENKVNSLLRACNDKAVFEVFNATMATAEEKELAQLVQNATKDSKIYQEVKDKIVEVCDDENTDLEAVFGLLAKFRHERNLLVTAIIKSNTEREKSNTEKDKALLCIKRVDDLMYMLQDVAKRPKDADGDTFMHRLGDIIMEIHDLAKSPSSLYDELLDIKEEHFQLVDDHDDMHQKFVDVNSCHDKLHTNHEKLQTSHAKLKEEYNEIKKKVSLLGGLKGDVSRLEKVVEKGRNENSDLKKEVEKLTAELAKVNALKHENAQLKKKITTLSTTQSTTAAEESAAASTPSVPAAVPAAIPPVSSTLSNASVPLGKKKKGKKGQSIPLTSSASVESTRDEPNTLNELASKPPIVADNHELVKLRKSHESLAKELETLKENIAQLEMLRRRAEKSRDQALEKLQLEQATSQNWQGIANDRASEKEQLKGQLDRSELIAVKLQSTVTRLEQNLIRLKSEISEQKEMHAQVTAELEEKSNMYATISSQRMPVMSQETISLLTKMRAETTQLIGDLEESQTSGGDPHHVLKMIQITVSEVVMQIEKDIDHILKFDSTNELAADVPEAVLPFAYHGPGIARHVSQPPNSMNPRAMEYSPQLSPHIPFSSHRPMVPPGFSEPSPPPSSLHSYSRGPESRVLTATPSSTPSFLNSSPAHLHATQSNSLPSATPASSLGPIGSGLRSTSANTNTTKPLVLNAQTKPSTSPIGPPATNANVGGGALGNGAVGVDWSMWSKPTK